MTLKQVEELTMEYKSNGRHGGYMDITEHPSLSALGLSASIKQKLQSIGFPNNCSHQAYVTELNSFIDVKSLRSHDEELSSFKNRRYNTEDGLKAAETILNKFVEYSQARSDVSVKFFQHSWLQPSVIARIEGQGPNADQVVIVGAHEDSIADTSDAPGADDDASGTSTVLEIFRVLCASGYAPDRTVEFHTYAAEEVGLWGSQAIASSYQAAGIPVYAMMQLDMTMYVGKVQPTFGIITDYVSPELTSFLMELVTAYSTLSYSTSRCGYGCSDHASWTKAGYDSCFPFEGLFRNSDPYIHSKNDLISHLSVEHGMEFAKVAVGFIVELSI